MAARLGVMARSTTEIDPRGGLTQDWAANRGAPESQALLLMFRTAQLARRRLPPPLGRAVAVLYRVLSRVLWGVELPVEVAAGPGLRVFHGQALVVNPGVVLGRDVTLRHSVTLGVRPGRDGCPVLGDGVDVGSGAAVLGPVTLGAASTVGANAVVLHDVAAGVAVVGNPARSLP